jgi:hypothetical protein
MYKHLFLKTKICPQLNNLVVLTDDIKHHIMDNRIYIPPPVIPPPVIPPHHQPIEKNIINIINKINNFIINMDTMDKLEKYMKHTQIELINFKESVRTKMQSRAEKFTRNEPIERMRIIFIDDINDIIGGKKLNELNIFYESKIKTINIYKNEIWHKLHVSIGIVEIVKTIQNSLWDDYEVYLIKKAESNKISHHLRQEYKEYLIEYYNFIGCFKVDPRIKEKDMYPDFSEKYMKIYEEVCDEITIRNSKNTIKKILEILSHNTIHNVKDMNKTVINLFNIDEEFKKLIISS